MTVKEIREAIKVIGKSARQIEQELGMPASTLNKAFLGKRDLPEKWVMPLLMMANPSKEKPEENSNAFDEGIKNLLEGGDVKNPTLSNTEDEEGDEIFDRAIDTHQELMDMIPEETEAPTLERQDPFDGARLTAPIMDEFGQSDLRFAVPWSWIKDIKTFCAANNCTPQDLMDNFKVVKKPESSWLTDLENKDVD